MLMLPKRIETTLNRSAITYRKDRYCPVSQYPHRVSKHESYEKELNKQKMESPIKIKDIDKLKCRMKSV